jgi:hypothetical protein
MLDWARTYPGGDRDRGGCGGGAYGWVQMKCRECAAEVSVTARVCSACGAPIVVPPPVMADTMTDSVAGAVSVNRP